MNSINSFLIRKGKEPRPWHYWICKKKKGALSKTMADLRTRKREYKRLGDKSREKAMKLLLNSGYGVFKYPSFDYLLP
jgi:DNA polymerase elongation subunit (family B)